MGLVFEGYPNIHGKPEHYEGGRITQKMKGDHFKNIESRYLNTMKAQLAGQQKDGSKQQAFINGLKDAQFQDIEAEIERQLAEAYNAAVTQMGDVSGAYKRISGALDKGIKTKNQAAVVKALNDLIDLFKGANNTMGLINEVNAQGLQPVSAELYELLGIGNLIEAVSKIENGELKYSSQWVNGLLTPSSEVLASYIDAMAEEVADEEIIKYLAKSQLGTKSSKVTVDFGTGGTKQVSIKSADIKARNVQFDVTTNRISKNAVTDSIVLNVDSYATVKTYRRNTTSKMISYAGENAIAMNLLHQIYGQSPQIDYQLYNTLAFHKRSGSDDLAVNFRIIRSDLVAQAAEKYIIGYTQTEAQRLLIHNYTAYPVLSILSAIARQAQEKMANSGEYVNKTIFNIDFDNIYKIKNTWATGEGSPNELKLQRIKETVDVINSASTRGFLNLNQFNKFIVGRNDIQGISLKNIVPKT